MWVFLQLSPSDLVCMLIIHSILFAQNLPDLHTHDQKYTVHLDPNPIYICIGKYECNKLADSRDLSKGILYMDK